MTDSTNIADGDLLRQVGEAVFGRRLPDGQIVWQREMSRSLGVPVSQLQAIVSGRALTEQSRSKLASWVRRQIVEEQVERMRRRELLKQLRSRVT